LAGPLTWAVYLRSVDQPANVFRLTDGWGCVPVPSAAAAGREEPPSPFHLLRRATITIDHLALPPWNRAWLPRDESSENCSSQGSNSHQHPRSAEFGVADSTHLAPVSWCMCPAVRRPVNLLIRRTI